MLPNAASGAPVVSAALRHLPAQPLPLPLPDDGEQDGSPFRFGNQRQLVASLGAAREGSLDDRSRRARLQQRLHTRAPPPPAPVSSASPPGPPMIQHSRQAKARRRGSPSRAASLLAAARSSPAPKDRPPSWWSGAWYLLCPYLCRGCLAVSLAPALLVCVADALRRVAAVGSEHFLTGNARREQQLAG